MNCQSVLSSSKISRFEGEPVSLQVQKLTEDKYPAMLELFARAQANGNRLKTVSCH